VKIFNILKINLFLALLRKAYPVWYIICFIKIALLHSFTCNWSTITDKSCH